MKEGKKEAERKLSCYQEKSKGPLCDPAQEDICRACVHQMLLLEARELQSLFYGLSLQHFVLADMRC